MDRLSNGEARVRKPGPGAFHEVAVHHYDVPVLIGLHVLHPVQAAVLEAVEIIGGRHDVVHGHYNIVRIGTGHDLGGHHLEVGERSGGILSAGQLDQIVAVGAVAVYVDVLSRHVPGEQQDRRLLAVVKRRGLCAYVIHAGVDVVDERRGVRIGAGGLSYELDVILDHGHVAVLERDDRVAHALQLIDGVLAGGVLADDQVGADVRYLFIAYGAEPADVGDVLCGGRIVVIVGAADDPVAQAKVEEYLRICRRQRNDAFRQAGDRDVPPEIVGDVHRVI